MADPLLHVEKLVRRFGGILATDHVSLDVAKGELHAIIGPNGAGKTTLISQLTGHLAPNSGSVLLAGRDITHLAAYRRSALGLAQSVNAPRSMTVSSERASADAFQSITSERLAAYLARRYRGFRAAENALVIEPSNVSQDRDDLAVTEHRTICGHGAYLALLDTLDDVFVAALGLRQFWT